MSEPFSTAASIASCGKLASIFGCKKGGLFILPFVGMVAEKIQGMNINIIKDWGVLVAAFGAVAYIVSIQKEVESHDEHMALELAKRDVKINLSYAMAIKGDRFTAGDGAEMRRKITRLEERLNAKNARISRIEEHIKDIDRRSGANK